MPWPKGVPRATSTVEKMRVAQRARRLRERNARNARAYRARTRTNASERGKISLMTPNTMKTPAEQLAKVFVNTDAGTVNEHTQCN